MKQAQTLLQPDLHARGTPGSPRFPFRGSLTVDVDIGTDIDIDIDVELDARGT